MRGYGNDREADHKTHRFGTGISTLTAALLVSSALCAVQAQEAEATDETPQEAQTVEEGEAVQEVETGQEGTIDRSSLERMVVTARKREESAQSVPLAVTSVTPEQLNNEGALTVQDLEGLVPSLVIDPVNAGPGGAAVSIRGISFEDIERSFEPTVGLVIDGIFLGTNSAQLTSAFDLESIEVLRGPQGTLFGRNTIGGVINVRRSRPTGEFGAKFRGNSATDDRQEYSAIVNVPLTDRGGLKFFVFNRDLDGFYDNVTLNERDGGQDYRNYGATVAYDFTDDLDILFTVERQVISGSPPSISLSQSNSDLVCSGIPGVLPPFAPASECDLTVDDFVDDFQTFGEFDDAFELREFDLTGEVNWRIGGVTVTSITGYRDSDELQTQDFDSTSAFFFQTSRDQTYRQFSQELRVAGQATDWLDFVLGFYFFDSNYTLDQETLSPLFFNADLLSNGILLADVEQDSLSYAFFGDFDINFTDRLRLNVGGRFTADRKDFRISNALNLVDAGLVIPVFDTTDPTQVPAGVDQNDEGFLESSFDDFSPRISLDFQATDDFFAYVSWSQGFRAGGFNGRAASIVSATTIYDPEDVNSFEAGFKSEWFNNRLRFNATGFVAFYEDRQEDVVQPIAGGALQETVVINASDSRFWGVELDSVVQVTDSFDIVGSFGYLNAEFDEFLVNGADAAGNTILDPATGEPVLFDVSDLTIRRAPPVTYSITGNYNRPLWEGDLFASLSWRFQGDFQTTIVNANPLIGPQISPPIDGPDTNGPAFNDPRGLSEKQGQLNFSVGYGWDIGGARVTASVYGRNVTDNVGLGAALPVAGLFTFGSLDDPRQFGGTIEVEF